MRVPDVPLDLRRRVPRHRDSGMDTYEGYTSSGTGRSTFYPTTTARHVLSEHCSYTVCSRVVTATLPVRERGNTVQRRVTHVLSEYRGSSHSRGFERS